MYLHPLLASLLFLFAGIGLMCVVIGGILVLAPRKQFNKSLEKYKSIDLEYR